ncbi:MAG: hypothetical protein GX053_00405 [Tissierella sp.]|nr:hypothetical protein [Tissierella sp.]
MSDFRFKCNKSKGVDNMSIIIRRNTGWQGMASKMQIKVNGEKVARVEEKGQAEVKLPKDRAYLQVTQSGVKSNEIEVKDGDIVEITSTKLYRMSTPLIIITMTILNILIRNSTYRLIVIIIIGILYTVSFLKINGFHLKVFEREK